MMFRAIAESSASTTQSGTNPSDARAVHFYCSSGGNAGLAAATSAAALSAPATIVVPHTTSPFMVGKLRDLGATVVQTGANWGEADGHLRRELLARERGRGVYVPPFDHADIWAGAATIVDELAAQMDGIDVHGIVCNVGGGGLLCGIMEGLEAHRKTSPRPLGGAKVLAVETVGAESLYRSVERGELVTLDRITSIATSLGAPRVAEECFEWTRRRAGDIVCATVSDGEAVMGSVRLLDDARMLVEVACGATIATAYNGDLRKELGEGMGDEEWASKNVVLVVCGGSNINLELLMKYKETYGV